MGIKGWVEIRVRYTVATMSLLVLHPGIRQSSYQVTGIFYKTWAFLDRNKMFSNKINQRSTSLQGSRCQRKPNK